MKKARTCFRCKASFHSDGLYYCSLNYKIDAATGTPKEPCPKPLSNPKLVKADKAQCHFAENDKQALIALLEPREKRKYSVIRNSTASGFAMKISQQNSVCSCWETYV